MQARSVGQHNHVSRHLTPAPSVCSPVIIRPLPLPVTSHVTSLSLTCAPLSVSPVTLRPHPTSLLVSPVTSRPPPPPVSHLSPSVPPQSLTCHPQVPRPTPPLPVHPSVSHLWSSGSPQSVSLTTVSISSRKLKQTHGSHRILLSCRTQNDPFVIFFWGGGDFYTGRAASEFLTRASKF